MNASMVVLMMVTWLVLMLVNTLIPMGARPKFHFGVSVPSEHIHHSELVGIVRTYLFLNVIAGMLLALTSIILVYAGLISFALSLALGIPVYVLGHMIIYANAHKQVKKLIADKGWTIQGSSIIAVDTSYKNRIAVSRLWYLFPLLLIAINVAVVAWHYDSIPDQFPIHYDAAGHVDRIGAKSIGIVFTPNVIQLALTLIFIGLQEGMIRGKRQLDPIAPEISLMKNKASRHTQALFLHGVTIILVFTFAILQCSIMQVIEPRIIDWTIVAVSFLIVVGAFLVFATTRQGVTASSQPVANISKSEDQWKWGMFYFNSQDPSVFIERMDGWGWTVNLGRPEGWICLVAPLILALFIILFSFL